jgi:hypothetical protein
LEQGPRKQENAVVGFASGVAALMLLYASAVDGFGLERQGTRHLFLVSLLLLLIASIARSVRLRQQGVAISISTVGVAEHRRLLLYLACAALLGAYAVREAMIGSLFVALVGIMASLSAMAVVTKALVSVSH